MLGLLRTIGLAIIGVVAAIFCIQNLATIEVAFLTWSISAPRAIVFLIVFALGLTGGYLARAVNSGRAGAHRKSNRTAPVHEHEPSAELR